MHFYTQKHCKMNPYSKTLEEQKTEFKRRKLIAMPIAGTLAWLAVGVSSLYLSPEHTVWVLFIATGSIVYLGMFISKLTGESMMDRKKPKNVFDNLFFLTVAQAIAVYSIALPFFMTDYTSLPLSVGILTGLMWFPLSWIIDHWIGVFHALFRILIIIALWYIFPEYRFTTIPFSIVALYLFTIVVLMRRYRKQIQS